LKASPTENEQSYGSQIKRRKIMKKTIRVIMTAVVASGLVVVDSALAGPKGPNLVEVASAVNSDGPYAGEFDVLIAAVGAADPAVAATLTGNGQHTVFAPTDPAFNRLGITTNNVASLPQELVTEVLLYHVAKGRRDAEQVIDSTRIRTLQGDFLLQDGGFLTDNVGDEAKIIFTDMLAANGIIHVIDEVLEPIDLPEAE
jgi:uncharacterized surface protein with fasciclin (FAS1) repeats